MSYIFNVSGHCTQPHNNEVKVIFDKMVAELVKLPGHANITAVGSTSDPSGTLALHGVGVEAKEQAKADKDAEKAEDVRAKEVEDSGKLKDKEPDKKGSTKDSKGDK